MLSAADKLWWDVANICNRYVDSVACLVLIAKASANLTIEAPDELACPCLSLVLITKMSLTLKV